MVCSVHCHSHMCCAPQRHALFQHLNFREWFETDVFWHFSVPNSKCASRHNGVQLFISHLASWLCTRGFSEPTFRPSGATNLWKKAVFRDFPAFSRTCIFFPLSFSISDLLHLLSYLFSLSPFRSFFLAVLFHLSILSEVWLPNFLRIVFILRMKLSAKELRRVSYNRMTNHDPERSKLEHDFLVCSVKGYEWWFLIIRPTEKGIQWLWDPQWSTTWGLRWL